MRFIQHKAEARWFYRVVSLGYDRWINPLFWTAPMRDAALALARLDDPALEVVDVGAGTGFATEAIVRKVAPERVTMLDQSPHQLARARRKRALSGVTKVLGDAEALPFATDSCDRYVSTGSIEYWPDPQRAIAEAYRVLRPGGVATAGGPLRRAHPLARRLSDAWMLFPSDGEYTAWMGGARVPHPRPGAARTAGGGAGWGRCGPPGSPPSAAWRSRRSGGGRSGTTTASPSRASSRRACRRPSRLRRRARARASASAPAASRGSRSARSPARRSSRSRCGSRRA